MGAWGPGALENDHAQDLLSIEVDRWRALIDEHLRRADAVWQDVEGPLVYVHLLVAHGGGPGELRLRAPSAPAASTSAEIATAWKARCVALWSPYVTREGGQARHDEIVRLFDALIALACTTDAPKKKARSKPAK